MTSFYRSMNSHPRPLPHQPNNILYPPHYPNWGVVPPQMNIDTAGSPVTFGHWPYGGSYGYSYPAECNGCCNHSYSPVSYNFRPPHSPLPPPPPFYHHGAHPPYPEPYPSYYAPHQHYSMEQPKYEYDKNMPGNHCCRCPNHSCNQKMDNNVKIEEQDPEAEKAGHEYSPPIKSANYPYPIVWIPPGYMKEKESSKPSESEPKDWSGWFPRDMNSTKSLKQGEDDRRKQDEMNEDKKTHFPFPIIWMPTYDKPKEAETNDLKEVSSGPKFVKEPPSFKIIPVKLSENDDCGDKPVITEDTNGSAVHSRMAEVKAKSIPVKQMEDSGYNKSVEDTGRDTKGGAVNQIKENGQKSSLDSSTKRQSSSPLKPSKLPPVCLRIDPFPRRKKANGTSRSPSPPGVKEKLQEESSGSMKDGVCQDWQSQLPNLDNTPEQQAKTKEMRTIEVENTRDHCQKEDANTKDQVQVLVNVPVASTEEISGKPMTEKEKMHEDKERTKEFKVETESKEDHLEEAGKERKSLSNTEAAVLVQSAYRGYEVRKWEPLKKLRQLARIREQADEVRDRICALESSAELQKNEKQRVVIGETIMSLLLQLDTIQGLHSSFREIRKSVARELVSLQEKLDSVTNLKSEESEVMGAGLVHTVEPLCETAYGNGCTSTVPNEEQKASELSMDLDKATHENTSQLMEPSHMSIESKQPLCEKDAASSSKDEEVVEALLVDEVQVNSEREATEEVVDPLLVDKEVEADSEREPTSEVGETPLVDKAQVEQEGESTESLKARCEELVCKAAELIMEPLMKPKDVVEDEELDRCPKVTVKVQEMNRDLEFGPDDLHEFPLVDQQKTDSVLEEHTSHPVNSSGIDEEALIKSFVAENQPSELSELSSGILDEEPLGYKREFHEELVPRSDEKPLVENVDSDSKQENLLFPPLDMEESQLEGPVPMLPVVGERDHVEVLKEVDESVDTHSLSTVNSLASDSTDNVAASMEDMEVTIQDGKDVFRNEEPMLDNEVPKVDKLMVGETEDHNLTSLPLEALVGTSELPIKEQENKGDITESEALTGEDLIGSESHESEVVKKKLTLSKDSAPACLEPAEEKGETADVSQDGHVPLNDNKKLAEDNEKLREMLEKLLQAGKEQLTVISDLNGRVRDLERKLRKKKNLRMRRQRVTAASTCV